MKLKEKNIGRRNCNVIIEVIPRSDPLRSSLEFDHKSEANLLGRYKKAGLQRTTSTQWLQKSGDKR